MCHCSSVYGDVTKSDVSKLVKSTKMFYIFILNIYYLYTQTRKNIFLLDGKIYELHMKNCISADFRF